MINKREFSVHNTKKVLHKCGKQWIIVSAALLMMLGGSAIATNVSHADSSQTSSAKVVPVDQPTVISKQAANLHSQILNHSDQVQNHQTAVSKNTAGTMNAPTVTTYSNNGVARLQKLQKLYSMYEMLVKSGVFSDSGNQTSRQPNHSANQPSTNHSGNQAPNISDTQASDNVPGNQSISSDNQVQQTLQQMKVRVLSDINNDRAKNDQPALQVNSNMNKIANQRAQQIEKKFTHYDNNGNSYYLEDANNDGIQLSDESASGENIGMQWFSPVTFTPDFGAQIADGTDHSMMYDDASSNWGHRANILSPNYHVVGIGTSYNGNGSFYIAEDFTANPPSDSSNNQNE